MPEIDWQALSRDVQQHTTLSSQIKLLKARRQELRDRMLEQVHTFGQPDHKNNLWIELPEKVNGVDAIQIQRRVSNTLDEEEAKTILSSIEVDGMTLWEQCIEMVPVLDEDRIYQFFAEGAISSEQLELIFPKEITEAFVTK